MYWQQSNEITDVNPINKEYILSVHQRSTGRAPGPKGPQMGHLKDDRQWQVLWECMWITITL